MRSCSSMLGIKHKFENQNILSFEDNIKFMGDELFAVYSSLKLHVVRKPIFRRHFSVSYAFVVSFHPFLKLE